MFGDGNTPWLVIFTLSSVIFCIIPMIALVVGTWIAFRKGQSFITGLIDPNTDQMQASFEKLREQYPNKTPDQLVRRVIQRQSVRCGLVGLVTSIGGFVTLPIALPIDMVLTYRIQGAMVNFIARAYGRDPVFLKEDEAVAALVMFGTSKVTTSATQAAMKVVLEVGGKTLSKVVPLAGAIIGFLMNYLTTQATGYLAAGVYSGQAAQTGGSIWQRVRRRGKGESEAEQV